MKHLMGITLAAGLALVMTGCSQKAEIPAGQDPALVKSKIEEAPEWVKNPSTLKQLVGIGSSRATRAGINFQRQEALANARDDLARSLEVRVRNMFKNFTQGVGVDGYGGIDKVASDVSRQVSAQTLAGVVQKDMWIAKDGEMFVMIGFEPEMLQKALRDNLTQGKIISSKQEAKEAFEELDRMIDKMVKEEGGYL